MTTSYTSLLGLALPVQGELSGTWGNEVNNYITEYLDASVAGTQIISGSLTAVTLSKTTNASLAQAGSGATGSSQYQIIRCSGNPASLLTITAPAASKVYLVINDTSTAQSVKLVGAGPTAGVTMVTGEKAVCAWNGSDFVKVASSVADGVTTFSAGTTGFTPSTATSGAVTLAGTLAIANGGTGTTSTTFANLTTNVTGTLPVGNGGTGAATLTANNVLLGNGTSALQVVAPGTNGNVLTSNGSTWTSAAAGASLSGVTDSASPFETALGYQAGNVTTGDNNTWVGYQAGLLNTTGFDNTAVGFKALDAMTTGQENVAIGVNALGANVTGQGNIAIGAATLRAATGSLNVSVGSYSNYNTTTGGSNVAVGHQVLFANTTGGSNTAVGYAALDANTTASNNTAIGYDALGTNTTGADNTAVGFGALDANTTGGNNVALGSGALGASTGQSRNVAIGYNAASSITAGEQNVHIGYEANSSSSGGNGQVIIGYQSGQGTTGNNNTLIGYQSGQALTSGTNNIVIGYAGAASSASVSNENTFGNSSTTSNRFWGDMKMGGSSAGTSGQVLTSAGAGAAPTWATAGGGSMVFLSTVTATNAATADVETTFNSTYDNYVIMATGVIGELDARTKLMLLKVGGTYQTSGYRAVLQTIAYNSSIENISSISDAFQLFDSHYAATNPNELSDFIVYIRRPSNATTYKSVNFIGAGFGAGTSAANNAVAVEGGGSYTGGTGAITGVRFQCSAGNITGTFRLYGIKNS